MVSATSGNNPITTSSTKLSFVPSTGKLTATSYGGAWAGSTIGTTYGGTGLTSFTANGVVYASSTSALATSSAFTFNGTDVGFTGNLVPGTSGKGINFSSTPGTGTSELLADYEEGTWTPNLFAAGGANPTFTSSGRYTKIGRTVTATAFVTFTSTAGSVGMYMNGVPFNAYSTSALTGFGSETTTSVTLSATLATQQLCLLQNMMERFTRPTVTNTSSLWFIPFKD